VQVKEHDGHQRGMEKLVDSRSENEQAIHEKGNADKKPNGNRAARFHCFLTRK